MSPHETDRSSYARASHEAWCVSATREPLKEGSFVVWHCGALVGNSVSVMHAMEVVSLKCLQRCASAALEEDGEDD